MGFCNATNITLALQKDNGKTFLLTKVEQIHLDGFKNIDFTGSTTTSFHVSNVRVFLYQSEKSKKIFMDSPRKDHQNFDFGTTRNRNSVIHGQEVSTVYNPQTTIGFHKGKLI
jgi:hypothetical protein